MAHSSTVPGVAPWQDPSRSVADRVADLLARMTLEEKAGQLGSFWEREAEEGGDVAPMAAAMAAHRRPFAETIEHGLGHLTRVFGSAPVSVPDGVARLREMQADVVATSRFGIPAIAHEECLTGLTALGATVYPTPLAWGATFHPELVEEMAAAIGRDMAAVGVHQGLSPVLDVTRDYRWGRTEETIGEDPHLVATVGTAYVRGLQSAGVLATLKHFAGYSASRGGRNHAPVPIGPRELADVILPPFEMAVRAGARSVMNSYADVDGAPPTSSRELLTGLLRERWGFTGTVVSDYWSVIFLELNHRTAADAADAGRQALAAGLDVELPETGGFRSLPDVVRAGGLDEAVLDTAVRRVLTQKAELGLLDAGWAPQADETTDLDPPANRALARRLAEESIVLLANDGTLPLAAGSARVAVVGPSADEPRTALGCYSFPNHVLSRFAEHGTGVDVPTILDSLRAQLPAAEVSYERGCAVTGADRSGIPAAVEVAAGADVAVVTVGDLAGLFGRGTSGEGCDAEDLRLPGAQHDLVEAVLGTGTPVVLVVVSGRPYALGGLAERCAAVVQAFFPGEEGGPALARVLTGEAEPGGRLPVGVPARPGGQPYTYLVPPLGRRSEGVSNVDPGPLFPFGHGLSYTTVEYSGLEVPGVLPADGAVDVAATVTNSGDRPCAEVVQLYLSDHVAQVTRPVRELIGYARVELAPGQCRRVTFTVHADRTSFTGLDLRRVVEPGTVTLSVGRSSEDLALAAKVEITGALRVVDGERVMTTPVRVD
ncbi:beta-glucosidase [Georgenia soli]|uniref:Beta-glucosidase n=1 Tax=Georgenia soli TaxID=638953 RepID=A0A2A9EQ14_9MICO|nr:glycoside hydrolase family 3 N-terminal domain-containing protein [Georgenia soli]PFG40330.1 beta-glucosidase [Georgenia soli]